LEGKPALTAVLNFSNWFMLALLSYNAYCHALTAKFLSLESPIDRFKRFIWRYILIFLLIGLLSSIPNVIIIRGIETVWLSWFADTVSVATFTAASLFVSQMIEFLILSAIGTWLPASILNNNKALSLALNRGSKLFFWTLTRLIIGPGFIWMLFSTFRSSVFFMNGIERYYVNKIIPLDSTWVGMQLLSPFLVVYIVVMISVIVSRTYLISGEKIE